MDEHHAVFSQYAGSRWRWLLCGCVLALMFGMLLPRTAGATQEDAPSSKALPPVVQIIRELNRQRKLAGLRPLRINEQLMSTAQRFSQVQAQMGALSHRGLDQTNAGQRLDKVGYNWIYWGETIAGGFRANEVVAAWLASPSHRRILFSPKATEIGAGHVVVARDRARYYDYWVINVGRRMPPRP